MDETFVHTSRHVPKGWQCEPNITLNVPIGKGDRYIIVHAGTKDGFIPNAHDVSKGKNSSADYHTDMNREKFEKWVTDNLLPNLPNQSVIILDNAPYHTVQEDRCPTMATKKADILAWMTKHGIKVPENKPIKATLIEICKQHKPRPSYRIDSILKRHGHETLRLPPYHADLNAIELIWANLKNFIARNNLTFKAADTISLITTGLSQIGPTEWMNCCKKVEEIENAYRKTDVAVDEELDKIVITLDSSTDTDFGDYEYSSGETVNYCRY